MKRPIHISTSDDIPFIGTTNYQQAFQFNTPKLIDREFRKNLSPIPQGPFFGETSNRKSFTPFKIGQSSGKREAKVSSTGVLSLGRLTKRSRATTDSSGRRRARTSWGTRSLSAQRRCTRRCGSRSWWRSTERSRPSREIDC